MLGHQTRDRSRHSKRQREVENPLVLVEQRKYGGEASEQDSDQEGDCEVYPKRRTELAVGKGRRTDYSLRQTEILEDQDESGDRHKHAEHAKIRRGQEPCQDDDGCKLNGDLDQLRDQVDRRPAQRASP